MERVEMNEFERNRASISSVLITKNVDTNSYETRFLPQHENLQDELSSYRTGSTIVDQMGGRLRLEALVVYLSQRVLDDSRLSPIFGAFSMDELVVLLGQMMRYALDDSFEERIETKKHYKSNVLKNLCRLGLMRESGYFDRLATHFLASMRVSSFRNARTVIQLGDRFMLLRAALQDVADRMAAKTTVLPTTFFSYFWNPIAHCTRRSHQSVVDVTNAQIFDC